MSDAVVDDFAAGVREFNAALDGKPLDRQRLLRALLNALATATRLPTTEPSTDQPAEDPPSLDSQTQDVATRLVEAFSDHDLYWTVLDPSLNDEPVAGSFSDDLVEVHRDLARGLALFDEGNLGDAVWEWRFTYETHWGRHAVEAVRVLHRLTAG